MTFAESVRQHPLRWGVASLSVLVVVAVVVQVTLPTAVEVVSVERRDLVRTFVLAGRVRPPSTAELGTSIVGAVQEVLVREGDRVRGGELLVLLDDREARARLREAEASLVEAAAAVESDVEIARAEATRAERDLERIRAMFEEGARTEQQVEQAEQRSLEARSRLQAVLASSKGDSADGVPASVVRARATVDAAAARLALTRIDAPADGVVLARWVEPGDVAQPGQPFLQIAYDGPAELVVFPAEEDVGALRVGAPALASADAYPDSTFEARVSLIAPAVDPDQGTVEVRLALTDPPEYLRAFMTVSVNIEAGRSPRAAVLPADVVREVGTDEPWVLVARRGRAERQAVDVGVIGEDWVEIVSGVSAEDTVIASAEPPEPGTRVRIRGSD